VPISIGNWKKTVLPAAAAAAEALRSAGVRVHLDVREEATPGWKFAEYEMRGVPLRVEVGPRDVKAGQAVLVRRDAKARETVAIDALPGRVLRLLEKIQANLFAEARSFLKANIRDSRTYDEFKETLENQRGFIRGFWCGDGACEDKIKEETMATIRVIPLDEEGPASGERCVCCGHEAKAKAYFARAY
jgi:prolyl-tRNA synthetase